MHELAITQSVLDIALEHAQNHEAKRIARINLVIGDMSGIVADCVHFYFDFISKDTIASDATLSFERVPTKARCRNCNATFPIGRFDTSCPNCHRDSFEIVAGHEFYVESIEIE